MPKVRKLDPNEAAQMDEQTNQGRNRQAAEQNQTRKLQRGQAPLLSPSEEQARVSQRRNKELGQTPQRSDSEERALANKHRAREATHDTRKRDLRHGQPSVGQQRREKYERRK